MVVPVLSVQVAPVLSGPSRGTGVGGGYHDGGGVMDPAHGASFPQLALLFASFPQLALLFASFPQYAVSSCRQDHPLFC